MTGDAFSEFDPIVRARDLSSSPWSEDVFVPDLDLLRELLSIPVSAGSTQETGRVAKAFDAWIAHEFRRAGFPQNGVWPRMRRPRVLPDDLADLEFRLEALEAELALAEADGRLKPASLRRAIRALEDKLPGAADAYVLGDFYSKQIDVLVSTWRRGPDLLVASTRRKAPMRCSTTSSIGFDVLATPSTRRCCWSQSGTPRTSRRR